MVERQLSDFSGEEKQRFAARKQKAEEMASKQREISVAEFFEKNRHLLGFDNKRKALLTTVKRSITRWTRVRKQASFLRFRLS